MSSNTFPIDLDYEKLRLLLRRLSQGLLDMDSAHDLKQLLEKERNNAIHNGDRIYENQLSELIKIINAFIEGEINLQTNPVSTLKTHRFSVQ